MVQKHLRPSIQMYTIIVSQNVFGFVILTYMSPRRIQMKMLSVSLNLNTKPYWQHLELIQIEDTVKQIKPEYKHLLTILFEIDSVVVAM